MSPVSQVSHCQGFAGEVMHADTPTTLFPERRITVPSHIPPSLHGLYREIVRRLELVEPWLESEAEVQDAARRVLMEEVA